MQHKDTAKGDLRSALRELFPEVATKHDDERKARADQKRRLAEISGQLARDRVPPTRATGTYGRTAAGNALQVDRGPDGRLSLRSLDNQGRDWTVQVSAEDVTPTANNHWKAPPPAEQALPVSVPDMSGRVFGRLTVLRYHRSKPKAGGSQWLVRCVCGDYELRTTRALNSAAADVACSECSHVDHLRWLSQQSTRRDRPGQAARLFDKLAGDQKRGTGTVSRPLDEA